jgi:iron complex transport system permease protein
LAGPYILGVSSGAKLAVALMMVAVVGHAGTVSSWMSVAAATVGSLAVTLCVLLASRRIRTSSGLIVAGVMVGYLCNAVTDFVVTFASDASIVNLRNWSMGSFSGTSWDDVRIMAAVVLVAATCVFLLSKPLGAYAMGQTYAQSVGVNVGVFRVVLIALSSVLAACVTAFAGPISFVGIAVPYVVKRMMGTSRPLVAVPAAFLGGAVSCLVCDLVARTAFAPTEMAVSTVTAALGAPVFMWMLLGRQRSRVHVTEASALAPKASIPEPKGSTPFGPELKGSTPFGPQVLAAQGLSVGYDGVPLVRDIDLAVRSGQVVTLIGPNGAGKSTLLKTLAGALDGVDGVASLCGEPLDQLSEHERALRRAVLLTDKPTTELLTCEDVVGMGRYPYTGRLGVLGDEDRDKVREAMELLEVAELADADFMQLSDGQRQRVMLARALCQEPRVLLLDEPTTYLDIRYQVSLLRTLAQLVRERGLAVVMTLHELSLARQASDWLVCIKDGAVVAQGTSADVFVDEVILDLYDLAPDTFDSASGIPHV